MARPIFFRCSQVNDVDRAVLLRFELRERFRVDRLHTVSICNSLRGTERLLEVFPIWLWCIPLRAMFQLKTARLPSHGSAVESHDLVLYSGVYQALGPDNTAGASSAIYHHESFWFHREFIKTKDQLRPWYIDRARNIHIGIFVGRTAVENQNV